MKVYFIENGGHDYEMVCDTVRASFCNSYGRGRCWQQVVEVFEDGNSIGRDTYNIYNRTWECWEYQSLIAYVFAKAIRKAHEDYWKGVKRLNGWDRLTQKRRKETGYNDAIKARFEQLNKVYELILKAQSAPSRVW